jgi:hypothetical protein
LSESPAKVFAGWGWIWVAGAGLIAYHLGKGKGGGRMVHNDNIQHILDEHVLNVGQRLMAIYRATRDSGQPQEKVRAAWYELKHHLVKNDLKTSDVREAGEMALAR